MTVFELIAFVTVVFGLVWGLSHAADGSVWSILRSGLLGAGKGFLAYALFMFVILIVGALGVRYRPSFPRCKKGKCGDSDFRFVYPNIEPDESADERDKQLYHEHRGLFVRCGCGDLYLRSDRDRKFYEVLEDRTLAPFMKYRFAGRWQKDDSGNYNAVFLSDSMAARTERANR